MLADDADSRRVGTHAVLGLVGPARVVPLTHTSRNVPALTALHAAPPHRSSHRRSYAASIVSMVVVRSAHPFGVEGAITSVELAASWFHISKFTTGITGVFKVGFEPSSLNRLQYALGMHAYLIHIFQVL